MKNTAKLMRLILTVCALLCPTLAFAQAGNFQTILLSGSGQPLPGVNVAVCSTGLTTTAASVTNNIATLTMSSNPITARFLGTKTLTVSSFSGGDTYFNGTYTIAAVGATTISYALTHANASAASNGKAFQTGDAITSCAPVASLFTDDTATVAAANPTTSDSIGNVSVWAASSTPYQVQYYGANVVTKVVEMSIGATNGSVVILSNLNSILFAGPGATPTIATQEAVCGSNPCMIVISSGYTGAESPNLVTSNLGYTYYNGPKNITIIDNRNVTVFGAGRNYSQTYGSYNLGQIDRFGVTQSCASVADSCVGATFTNFISGTMPSNVGTQTGLVGIAATDGANFDDSSGSAIVGIEGQVALNATGASSTIANSYGMTSSVNILRTTATQSVTNASSYHSGGAHNSSVAGATITNAYGFDANRETVATTRNYGFHNKGDWLTENSTHFDAVDLGGTPRVIINFPTTNLVEFRPMTDANGFEFETQAAGQLFHIDSSKIISRVSHQFVLDIIPSVTAVPSLGNLTFWWKGISVGSNGTGATTWSPTVTSNRTLTSPDGNSSTVMPASLVTTAAASDNVAVTGMTASGHCTFSPTNAAGATNIATTFISAKAANQITVSHAVTANMNYDIFCTSN